MTIGMARIAVVELPANPKNKGTEFINKPINELTSEVVELMMRLGCRTPLELVDKAVESKVASLAAVNSLKSSVESLHPFNLVVRVLPELREEIEGRVLRLRSQQIRASHGAHPVRRV